jgi:adenylate cyclase
MKVNAPEEVLDQPAEEFFAGENSWILECLKKVGTDRELESIIDGELVFDGEKRSVNLTLLPLSSVKHETLGSMIMIEDISSEKRMKSTMSRYMDPGLADKLMEESEDLLGGASSIGTVLFSDIRSFTTLTEELGPQGTVTLLNEYFTIMVECITNEGGMLDKFIGDSIMAIFGTPFAHDDDPDRALRAAVEMMRQLRDYNDRRINEGKIPIDHGLGISTDNIVSGNIGSSKRMDYTVIGDGVNLASRLESACKQYGAHIIISEFTLKQLKATYRTREIDQVIVKGKTQPVGVYEVVDYHDETTFPNMIDVLGHFNNGVQHYKAAKWDASVKEFKQALKLNPDDKVSQMYVERCELLKANPPTGKWDGVWVMQTK